MRDSLGSFRPPRLLAATALSSALLAASCESVEVVTVEVSSVAVSPEAVTLQPSEQTQLSARVVDGQGNTLTGRAVQWASMDPGVATVSPAGLVLAMAKGTTTIRATAEGRSGSSTVRVVEGPTIEFTLSEMFFAATQGEGAPPHQIVMIENAGAGVLDGLSVGVSFEGPATGWLRTLLSTTTAPAELRLTVDPGQLDPGTYRATVSVESPSAENSPRAFAVVLSVSQAPPLIGLSPASVGFSAIEGESDPTPKTVDITNEGDGTLPGLSVSVIHQGPPEGWLEATLSGATAPAELNLQARTGSLDEGVYTAVVRVSAPAAPNSPRDVSVTFTVGRPPPTDVSVRKAGPDTVGALSAIEYVVVIRNEGPALAVGVVVQDRLPDEVEFESASHGGVESNGVVTWPAVAQLAVGDSAVRTVVVTAPDSGQVLNVASSTAVTDDPAPGNNDGTDPASRVITVVNPEADVELFKTGPDSVDAATSYSYSIQIFNRGPSAATDVTVRDSLPAEVSFVAASPGAVPAANGVITWPTLPVLEPGAAALYQVTVTAPANAPAGPLLNRAYSTSGTADPIPINNNGTAGTHQVLTEVFERADVAVAKSGPARATAGQPIVYSITVSNAGPSDADGVVVRDTLPSGAVFVSASNGGSASGRVVTWPAVALAAGDSFVRSVTATAPAAGPAVNVAVATATTFDPVAGNNNGSNPAGRVTTTINRLPTAAISAPPANAVFLQGTSVSFSGTGSDPEDGALTGASLAWSSSRDGSIGTGSSFSTSGLSAGTHVITLRATDSEGASGTATRTLRIHRRPTASITSPANSSVFAQGATVTLVGAGSDPDDGPLTGAALTWSSDRDGNLGSGSPRAVTGLSVGTHVVTLTVTDSDGATDTDQITILVNARPSATVSAPAAGSVFQLGASVTLVGSASDPEDGPLTGASLAWTSSIGGSLGSGSPLAVSTLAAGTHVITLTATDSDGATDSDQVTIRVNAPPTASITGPPNNSVHALGATVPLAGTGTDAEDGSLPGASLAWASDLNGGLGTGSSLPTSTLSAGTHTITLTATDSDGATDQDQITVRINRPPTASITAPSNGSLHNQGQTVTFTGSGSDPENGSLPGGSLGWSSSLDGALGTGASLGTSTLSAGAHVITLTATDSDGAIGTAQIGVTINAAPTASIATPAEGALFQQGASVSFSGSGADPEQGALTGASLQWTSDLDGGIGSGASFSVTTLSIGAHTVTLTATDSNGATGTDQVSITVNGQPVASITAPTSGTVFAPGAEITFSGTGTDPEDGALTGAALQWSSNLDGAIGTGTSFSTTTLSTGVHTITLTASDGDGGSDAAQIVITVT